MTNLNAVNDMKNGYWVVVDTDEFIDDHGSIADGIDVCREHKDQAVNGMNANGCGSRYHAEFIKPSEREIERGLICDYCSEIYY
jgi:hypothetical protein